MATTPSREIVPGYGMGLVTYVTGDFGAETFRGMDMEKAIEDLAAIPMGQKLYIRPTWRELQKKPGRLDPEPYWKATFAARETVREAGRTSRDDELLRTSADAVAAGLRPRARPHGPPAGRVEAHGREAERQPAFYEEPRYDHPVLPGGLPGAERAPRGRARRQPAGRVLRHVHVRLLGRGPHLAVHEPPLPGRRDRGAHVGPMFEVQLEHWKKTPLVTNTQPDYSRVGNSELVDRTVRSHNWLRTDTIFIENEQIEAISATGPPGSPRSSRSPWPTERRTRSSSTRA